MPFVAPGDVQLAPALFPSGAPNNNISTNGGGVAATPVVSSLYDYDPFSIMRSVFERHGQPPTFLQMLDMLGPDFNRGVAAPTTGHYEKDWVESLVKLGAIVTASTGPGTQVIVALHADSMYNTNVTVGGVAAQASYPRVGQMIYFKNGKKGYITAKNTAVLPHRLTLKPLLTTVDLAGAITATESYFISDNAHAQGSGLPPGVLPRIYKYINEFQIAKEACASTGTELTNKLFVQFVPGQDGNIFMAIDADMQKRFDNTRSGMLLWGQTINNITDATTVVDYDVAVKGTEGFIQWLQTNASSDTYTAGAYVIDDFYALTNIEEQQAVGTNELMTWDGYGLWVAREKALQAFFANNFAPALMQKMLSDNKVSFDDWQPGDDMDFIAWMGFRAVHVGGFTIYFKKLQEFTQAVGAGATGYTFKDWSIIGPLSNVTDQSTGRQRAYIGYEWKEMNSYSRKVVLGDFAGVGAAGQGGYRPIATNQYDSYHCGLVSEQAFHGACPNKMILQTPA